jgi:hypothetical protein
MKLILNIGMHKTGTTSIQRTLHNYVGETAAYLDAGHWNHSGVLMTMFMSQPETYSAHKKNSRSLEDVDVLKATYFERLYAFCNKHADKDIISSAEDIGLILEDDLRGMKETLDATFDDYLIVGYVRPPNSLMASAFQQRVAGGVAGSNAARLYPNYRSRLEKFDTVFGRKNVLLTRFDRSSLFEGDVVLDFAAKAGIELAKDDIVTGNTGRSLETTAVAYALQTRRRNYVAYPGSPNDNRKLMSLLETFGSTKVKLHNELTQPILDSNKDDLDWVSERLGTEIRDEPSTDEEALTSFDQLKGIAAGYLPEVSKLLADTAASTPVEDIELVADTLDLLRRLIKAQRENRNRAI